MWARLAHHRSEDAIEPYLVCVTLHQTVKDLGALPGRRQLQYDARTGLSPELPLVGYDRDRAAAALPGVRARLRKLGEAAPPGLRLYRGRPGAGGGRRRRRRRRAGGDGVARRGRWPRSPRPCVPRRSWPVARAAEAFSRLERLRAGCLDTNRPLIGYLLGTARLARGKGDPRDGVLDLLDVAASHGEEQPVLAAAALYAAQKALDDQHDAAAARGRAGRAAALLPRDGPRRPAARRAGAGLGRGPVGRPARGRRGGPRPGCPDRDARRRRARTWRHAPQGGAGPQAARVRRSRRTTRDEIEPKPKPWHPGWGCEH